MTRKKKVLALVGKSGSGKSSLANHLNYYYDKFNLVESYTTRPRRYPEEGGHTYITNKQFEMINNNQIVAYNKFGTYHYFALKDQFKPYNVYVVDDKGLDMLLQHDDTFDTLSIRITRLDSLKSISAARKSRDEGQFRNNLQFYDYHITNNTMPQDLYDKTHTIIQKEWGLQ